MTQKLVSVIIPNYNSSKFIQETLNSVLKQTYKNIELIIVDDGSTDGSYEYISSLDEPNLKLVKNLTKGACAARNYGLRLATGHYIQFLDADDLLDLNKIDVQVKLLENCDYNIAVCGTKHFYKSTQDGVITDTPFLFSTNKPHDFLLSLYGADGYNQNMVAQHAWLTPKSVIDQAGFWDENLIKDQDGEFFCRVVMASKGVCFANNTICYYRKYKQSKNVSSGKTKMHILSQLVALKSKEEQLRKFKYTQAFKNAMALQYKIIGISAYPEYKAVCNESMKKSMSYGGSSYVPVLGGKIIELLKSLFGWKFAKLFRLFSHKIKGALY
jgi:glycosyltransferase involved in cell wall biosynthesis